MFEKTTWAFGLWDSTVVGAPELAAQVPRLSRVEMSIYGLQNGRRTDVTPAALGALVGGYGASSQSMFAAWSSSKPIRGLIIRGVKKEIPKWT
jgi:hypothetical protein